MNADRVHVPLSKVSMCVWEKKPHVDLYIVRSWADSV